MLPFELGEIFLELESSEEALFPEDEYLDEVGVSMGVSIEDWRKYLLTMLDPWLRDAERETELSLADVDSLRTVDVLDEFLREE